MPNGYIWVILQGLEINFYLMLKLIDSLYVHKLQNKNNNGVIKAKLGIKSAYSHNNVKEPFYTTCNIVGAMSESIGIQSWSLSAITLHVLIVSVPLTYLQVLHKSVNHSFIQIGM